MGSDRLRDRGNEKVRAKERSSQTPCRNGSWKTRAWGSPQSFTMKYCTDTWPREVRVSLNRSPLPVLGIQISLAKYLRPARWKQESAAVIRYLARTLMWRANHAGAGRKKPTVRIPTSFLVWLLQS